MVYRVGVLSFIMGVALLWVGWIMNVSASPEQANQYGTYLGGQFSDYGRAIAIDAAGNAYITGLTESAIFPTVTMKSGQMHGIDVFIAKFNAQGSQAEYILWLNALALNAIDEANDIVVDAAGYAFVTGLTHSDDFCQLFGSVPGYDQTYNGSGDAFLLKIEPDGRHLTYCTFLGGSDFDVGTAVGIDKAGNAVVSGGTWSTDFITSSNTIEGQHNGLRDLFLLRLDVTGTAVLHASYIGGSGQEESRGLDLDSQGNVYLTGWTNSSDFITTTGAMQPGYGGAFDSFIVKVNPITPTLQYATYLGGSDEDRGNSISVDGQGRAMVGGLTLSPDFPTMAGAFATTPPGSRDGFVARLNEVGSQLSSSTYLGGSGHDELFGLALDAAGRMVATGDTQSIDFPVTADAISLTLTGGRSAFLTVFDSSGSQQKYSTYLGGNNWDQGLDIAVAGNGRIYISGATRSTNFPLSANAYALNNSGDYDIFFANQPVPFIKQSYGVYLPVMMRPH
ncbi:MAG: hypothetical protein GY796_34470 [Chloroflexi bacterium]|nr:hypothetical protein [Chloroflexota bacterium]